MRAAFVPAVAALSLGLVGLAGCQGCGTSVEASQARSGATTARSPSARSATGAGSGHAKPPSAPPPDVSVTGEPTELAAPDRRVPVVTVHGATPVHLAREVAVEQAAGGSWRRVASVTLRGSCDSPPPADRCVTLVPGAELRPPPWLGTAGRAQCQCKSCERLPAGRYRFVVTSCDGEHQVVGAPFGLSR